MEMFDVEVLGVDVAVSCEVVVHPSYFFGFLVLMFIVWLLLIWSFRFVI